jgi:AcrR family transcriptional regulator
MIMGAGPDRLPADERRQALLDVALDLLRRDGVELVTMGTVAEQAEVTRALLYKHFANREDLLLALFRREASKLDCEMQQIVGRAPDGFEPKLRAFIRAALEAVESHGPIFVPLRPIVSRSSYQREQQVRDRRTVKYFAELATQELDLTPSVACAAMPILLAGINAMLVQIYSRPTAQHRRDLEDLYLDIVLGALRSLAASPHPSPEA